MKTLNRVSIVALALIVGQSVRAQNVTNGGFGAGSPGTPVQITNGPSGNLSSWTAFYGSSGTGGNIFLDQTGNYSLTAYSGNPSDYLLDLTGGTDSSSGTTGAGYDEFGGVSQTITGLTADSDYALTFALGNYSNYDYSGYLPGIYATATGNPGQSFFASAAATGSNTLWNYETYDFSTTGTSATINLAGFDFNPSSPGTPIGPNGFAFIGLDDVGLAYVGPATNGGGGGSGVPDASSTLVLMALGLGCLAFRKKFQAHAA